MNQQIEYDFAAVLGARPGTLRLEETLVKEARPKVSTAAARGDAILYVSSSTSKDDPEGFHARNEGAGRSVVGDLLAPRAQTDR